MRSPFRGSVQLPPAASEPPLQLKRLENSILALSRYLHDHHAARYPFYARRHVAGIAAITISLIIETAMSLRKTSCFEKSYVIFLGASAMVLNR